MKQIEQIGPFLGADMDIGASQDSVQLCTEMMPTNVLSRYFADEYDKFLTVKIKRVLAHLRFQTSASDTDLLVVIQPFVIELSAAPGASSGSENIRTHFSIEETIQALLNTGDLEGAKITLIGKPQQMKKAAYPYYSAALHVYTTYLLDITVDLTKWIKEYISKRSNTDAPADPNPEKYYGVFIQTGPTAVTFASVSSYGFEETDYEISSVFSSGQVPSMKGNKRKRR